MSCQIAVMAAFLGIILGVPLAFFEISPHFAARMLARAFVYLFRGTPMLVQILFVYYVLPQFGILIPPFSIVGIVKDTTGTLNTPETPWGLYLKELGCVCTNGRYGTPYSQNGTLC